MTYNGATSDLPGRTKRLGEYSSMGGRGKNATFRKMIDGSGQKNEYLVYIADREGWEVWIK